MPGARAVDSPILRLVLGEFGWSAAKAVAAGDTQSPHAIASAKARAASLAWTAIAATNLPFMCATFLLHRGPALKARPHINHYYGAAGV